MCKIFDTLRKITKRFSESTSTIADIISLIASLKIALENTLSSELSENPEASTSMSDDNDDYEKGKQVIGFRTKILKDELDRRFLELEN